MPDVGIAHVLVQLMAVLESYQETVEMVLEVRFLSFILCFSDTFSLAVPVHSVDYAGQARADSASSHE